MKSGINLVWRDIGENFGISASDLAKAESALNFAVSVSWTLFPTWPPAKTGKANCFALPKDDSLESLENELQSVLNLAPSTGRIRLPEARIDRWGAGDHVVGG